jgi:hypothetical protein
MHITCHVTKHFQVKNLPIFLALSFTNKSMAQILVGKWGFESTIMGVY